MRDGKLTVAGALLFASDPSAMMPQARACCATMARGPRLVSASTSRRSACSAALFPGFIEGAYSLISGMLREFQFLVSDGKFRTVPEYPEFAWFEGLVNAVTYRDYAYRGDYVRVSVFDDRLEIVSPGALPNIVTLDNMMTTRYSRNPRIARTLVEFGWVRELNEGVPRIYSEMQSMLLKDPTYSELGGAKVQLMLENNIVARTVRRHEALEDRLTEGVVSALDEYELAAVRLAFTNGRVTAKELAERIGRSQRTATRVLKGIAGPEGLLEWHGSSINDPRQFYALR